jgi:hypothetical protein
MIQRAAEPSVDVAGWADAITAPVIVAVVLALVTLLVNHSARRRVARRNTRNATDARTVWEVPERRPETPEPLIFSVGPFPRTVKSITGLRMAFGQSYPIPRYSVRRPPAVVVDLDAVSLHDASLGTILRIPSGRISSLEVRKRWIWPRFSPVPIRPWSLVLEVLSGGDEQALVLTPVPSKGQEIGRADVEAIASGMLGRLRIVRGAA